MRALQLFVGHAGLVEFPQSQPALERGRHIVFEGTVPAKNRTFERGGDLVGPGDSLEVAIDRKYFQ